MGRSSTMNAIMMINDWYIYAAIPSEEHYEIIFYTSDTRYKEQVPMIIRKWTENYFFQSVEVIYTYVAI